MTLVLVLWVVAALTVLVAGLVRAQHGELRLASAARSQLNASASGRAAIQLIAQELAASAQPVTRLLRQRVQFLGLDVDLEIMPLVGLIDLNLAPESLLVALFQWGGGQPEAQARTLAAAVLQHRQQAAPAGGRAQRFDATEELLALSGVDHDLFARIAPLMTTDSAGGGRVNALAAPLEVLVVLANGDAALAERIAGDRDAGSVLIDTTRFEGAYIDATVSSRYRITAHVSAPDGLRWAVAQDIDLHPGDPGGAPWQVLRTVNRRSGELSPSNVGR